MTRIHINASTPYDVVIEEGALQRITDYIKPLKTKFVVLLSSAIAMWHRTIWTL